MPELTISEKAKPLETVAGQYSIHFEPGVHPFPLTDMLFGLPTSKEIRDRFKAGDLTAHAWNSQVAERMRTYKPLVLGLDSVSGSFWGRKLSWPWLPGSPKEMGGRESIYVVGGNVLHQDFLFSEEGNKIGWGKVADYTGRLLVGEGVGGHILLPRKILTIL